MKEKEKEKVLRKLLEDKVPYSEISKILRISKPYISGHAKVFGFPRKTKIKYDWAIIQKDLDSGMSVSALRRKYGFAKASFGKAIITGKIIYNPVGKMSAKEFSNKVNGIPADQNIRRRMKQLLRKEGREYKCQECGILEWNNKKIVFDLDHINGDSSNNNVDNLRFLCPNCHSQTVAWRGRNIKRKKELLRSRAA